MNGPWLSIEAPVEKSSESEFAGTTPRKIEKVISAVNGFDPFELTRDVFENNLGRLENVWKEDRLVCYKFRMSTLQCGSSAISANLTSLSKAIHENSLMNSVNFSKCFRCRERVNKFVGMRDIYGLTPVHLAFRLKREEYLQMFLHSASPDFFQRNETILDEAVNMGDRSGWS